MAAIPPPAIAPAAVLASMRSDGVTVPVSLVLITRPLTPQKVDPNANHWKPEATANRPGDVERMSPAVPPTRRPAVPRSLQFMCPKERLGLRVSSRC